MSLNEQRDNVRRSRVRLDLSRERLDKLDVEQVRASRRSPLAGFPGRTGPLQASIPRRTASES